MLTVYLLFYDFFEGHLKGFKKAATGGLIKMCVQAKNRILSS